MSTYLVTVPVTFEDEPNVDFLSALNDVLSKHDPQNTTFSPDAAAGEFVTRSPSTGRHLFRLVLDADDQDGAQAKGRVLVSDALLDAGRTVKTAPIDTEAIEVEPWGATASS